jgi:CheY-like chemotaxis protein
LRKPLTPVVSEPFAEVGGLAREVVRGLVILWVDDDSPKTDSLLFQELTRFGAEVTDVPDRDLAVRELRRRRPDVLLSDVTRFGDDEAGFTDLEYFRHEGLYDGPVIFYTGGVTPTKLRRATDLGVAAITDNPAEVLRTLVSLATGVTGATV